MLGKVLDQETTLSLAGFDAALCACLHAKNCLVSQSGRSPYMGAFGRLPRVPTELMDARNTPVSLSIDEALRQGELVRCQAMQAFLQAEQETALRAAINRKPVHLQHWNYSPGDPIAYYRNRAATRGNGRTLRPGWLTGTFVCYDPGHRKDQTATLRGEGRNAWIHTGGRLIMVALEQLRPASGHEHWVPTDRDWTMINQLRSNPAAVPLAEDVQLLPEVTDEQLQAAPIIFDDAEYVRDITAEILQRDTRVPGTPAPLPGMAASSTAGAPVATADSRRRTHEESAQQPEEPPAKLPRSTTSVLHVEPLEFSDVFVCAWDGSDTHTIEMTGWTLRDSASYAET
eukprot:4292372-Amphidinium_carterae.1